MISKAKEEVIIINHKDPKKEHYLRVLVELELYPSYKLLEEGTTLANIKREQDNLINNFIDKLDKEYRDLSNCKKIILDAIKNLNKKFNSKQG